MDETLPFKFKHAKESSGNLEGSDSESQGWGLTFDISCKLLGDARAAGLRNTEHTLRSKRLNVT